MSPHTAWGGRGASIQHPQSFWRRRSAGAAPRCVRCLRRVEHTVPAMARARAMAPWGWLVGGRAGTGHDLSGRCARRREALFHLAPAATPCSPARSRTALASCATGKSSGRRFRPTSVSRRLSGAQAIPPPELASSIITTCPTRSARRDTTTPLRGSWN